MEKRTEKPERGGRRKRRRNAFSKRIVMGVLILNVLFAVAVLVGFWHTGNEPSALVAAWFAFTTGELWTLGKIKREKKEDGE